MTITSDYPKFVASRVKKGSDIKETLTPTKVHLMHMALGIAGETFELHVALDNIDTVNIQEETGDLLFYSQGIAQAFGTTLNQVKQHYPPQEDQITYLAENADPVIDLIKKFTIYNQKISKHKILQALSNFLTCLEQYADLEQAEKANIKKLSERYSSGSYTDKQAANRADKK